MAHTVRKFLPAVLALSLAVVYPAANAQSSPAAASGSSAKAGSSASAGNQDKAIESLMAAAQLLRESIQRMAQAPAGEGRTQAIRQGNEALLQVNNAMLALPPNLLLANADEKDYSRVVTKIKDASDKLYTAVHALAKQPASTARNQAIQEINQALMETNAAMVSGMTMQANKTAGTGTASTASGSSAGSMSGASGSADTDSSGSAARTGRPPGNNVDLTGSGGAASGSGTAGTSSR